MNLWESVLVSIEGLSANKMRSILTMLGVIIGVSSVIAMLGLAAGAKAQMMNRIQQMGTNVLIIRSGQSRMGPVMGGSGSVQTLTLQDAEAIPEKCPSVVRTAPEVQQNAQVKYGHNNTNTQIQGTTPDFLLVRNFSVAEGRFFSSRDVDSSRKVAVIGATAAQNLFGGASPIGKSIHIKGTRFKVIGLLKVKGASGFGDADDQICVPVTTAMRRIFGIQNVRSISAEAKSMKLMNQASAEITALLRKRHHLSNTEDDDFFIRNQAEIMDFANQTSGVFTLLLGGIASVSLLVGGIGIMNIMLVSVTERTREIGIRMALGARRRDIMLQFLVEALVLSLLGGLAGIVLGVFLAFVVANAFGWKAAVTPMSIAMSFCFAAFVGIFFGLYPARKAARLDPIEALRYE